MDTKLSWGVNISGLLLKYVKSLIQIISSQEN